MDPVALGAFARSLPPLWANPHGGPVTIAAYDVAGEMRSVGMTRILAYMLSAFPARWNQHLQVYHLSALEGHWLTSPTVLCADADVEEESSRGMCAACRADLSDGLTLQLFRQLCMPTFRATTTWS